MLTLFVSIMRETSSKQISLSCPVKRQFQRSFINKQAVSNIYKI